MIDRMRYRQVIDGISKKPGRPRIPTRPGIKELRRLYVDESKSIRDVAAELDCSKDMVARSLKEHGIERRSRTSNKKLADYSMENLVADVQEKGIRGLARELRVTEGAIRYHLRKLD